MSHIRWLDRFDAQTQPGTRLGGYGIRRIAPLLAGSLALCLAAGPVAGQSPPATGSQSPDTPVGSTQAAPATAGAVRRVTVANVPGRLLKPLVADLADVTVNWSGGPYVDLTGPSASVRIASDRIGKIDFALASSAVSVEVPLRRLGQNDARTLLRDGDVDMSMLGGGIVILKGQPDAVEAARARVLKFDEQFEQKWQEDQKAREAAADRETVAQEQRNRAARDAQARNSITIEFAGGTVGDYLKQVAAKIERPNVILANDAIAQFKLPAVTIKSVTASAAIRLLESLPFERNGVSANLTLSEISGDPDGAGIGAQPIYVLNMLSVDNEALATKSPPIRTEVFNLGTLERHDQPMLKGLLEAITAGLELNGKSASFSMKFHEGSGLLFVRGTNDDISMVERIVTTIAGNSAAGKNN